MAGIRVVFYIFAGCRYFYCSPAYLWSHQFYAGDDNAGRNRRKGSPLNGIIDSQSVKEKVKNRLHEYDAGRKIKGRKRHINREMATCLVSSLSPLIFKIDRKPSVFSYRCANFTHSPFQVKPINAVSLDPDSLAEALQAGVLLPNLFLTFLVMALLPKIRVVGGLRQIAYFPLFQKVLLSALDLSSRDELEFALELNTPLHGWGMRVFEQQGTVLEQLSKLPQDAVLSELWKNHNSVLLFEATEGLRNIRNHVKWHALID